MQNLEKLPVTDEAKKAIQDTDANYRRFLKIGCDILEVNGSTITVKVEQFRRLTDKVYSQKELVEKAKEVFSHLPPDFKVHYRALVWKGEGIDAVSAEWVRNQLKKYSLRQEDLADLMNVDKHVMSKVLSNQFGFTNWHKAAFYWFFKNHELTVTKSYHVV